MATRMHMRNLETVAVFDPVNGSCVTLRPHERGAKSRGQGNPQTGRCLRRAGWAARAGEYRATVIRPRCRTILPTGWTVLTHAPNAVREDLRRAHATHYRIEPVATSQNRFGASL